MSLCHILVIIVIFQPFSLLLYLWWWSMISDLWCCSVSRSCPALCNPVDCRQPESSVHGILQGKNTGVSCHFLLQGIFLTQGSNPCLPQWQADSLPLGACSEHVCWVSDAIQPSHPLLPSPPFAFNLCQHHSFFQWVSSLHQVAKVLEFHFQHQCLQWIFRVDFLYEIIFQILLLYLCLYFTHFSNSKLCVWRNHWVPLEIHSFYGLSCGFSTISMVRSFPPPMIAHQSEVSYVLYLLYSWGLPSL